MIARIHADTPRPSHRPPAVKKKHQIHGRSQVKMLATNVGVQPHLETLRVIVKLPHTLQTSSHDRGNPAGDLAHHFRISFAQAHHKFDRRLAYLLLLGIRCVFDGVVSKCRRCRRRRKSECALRGGERFGDGRSRSAIDTGENESWKKGKEGIEMRSK